MGGDRCDRAVPKDTDEQLGQTAGRPGWAAGIAHDADVSFCRERELPDALAVLQAPAEAQPVRAQDPIFRIDERGREHTLVHRSPEGLEGRNVIWNVEKYVPFDSFLHSCGC
jgi:hypothetical protein